MVYNKVKTFLMSTLLSCLAVMLSLGAASSTTIPVWHGPGQSPCDADGVFGPAVTECSNEWAWSNWQQNLDPELLEDFHMAVTSEPPSLHFITSGNVILVMGSAGPEMLYKTMVASLADGPVAVVGWKTGNIVFGVIIDCGNPVIFIDEGKENGEKTVGTTTEPHNWRVSGVDDFLGVHPPGKFNPSHRGSLWLSEGDDCSDRSESVVAPAPVPVPASLISLLLGLGSFAYLGLRKGRT